MRITATQQLETLSKDELLEVATDHRNDKEIQDAALERWLRLDDKDFSDSITKLKSLIDTAKRLIGRSDDTTAGHGA